MPAYQELPPIIFGTNGTNVIAVKNEIHSESHPRPFLSKDFLSWGGLGQNAKSKLLVSFRSQIPERLAAT